jgi:hypothetical protein
MRETRQSGSEGGEVQTNEPSLPLSLHPSLRRRDLAALEVSQGQNSQLNLDKA